MGLRISLSLSMVPSKTETIIRKNFPAGTSIIQLHSVINLNSQAQSKSYPNLSIQFANLDR